jgi:hypothetical protein
MDRQAWIAVTLCIIGLIAWQVYMEASGACAAKICFAEPGARVGATLSSWGHGCYFVAEPGAWLTEFGPTSATTPPNEATPTPAPFVEKTTTLRNADLEVLLTNRGGGIAEAILPKHKGENGASVKLNVDQRLPIGAIIEKPATPVLEEFSIVPRQDAVQFERALSNNVTLRKKFSPPARLTRRIIMLRDEFDSKTTALLSIPIPLLVFLGPRRQFIERSAELHTPDLVYQRQDQVDRRQLVQNYPFIWVQKALLRSFSTRRLPTRNGWG